MNGMEFNTLSKRRRDCLRQVTNHRGGKLITRKPQGRASMSLLLQVSSIDPIRGSAGLFPTVDCVVAAPPRAALPVEFPDMFFASHTIKQLNFI